MIQFIKTWSLTMVVKTVIISAVVSSLMGCGLVKVQEQSESNRSDIQSADMAGNDETEGMYLTLPVLPQGKFERAVFKIYSGKISYNHIKSSCLFPTPVDDPTMVTTNSMLGGQVSRKHV